MASRSDDWEQYENDQSLENTESRRVHRRVNFSETETPPLRPPPPRERYDSSYVVPETPSFSRERSDNLYSREHGGYRTDSRRHIPEAPYYSTPYSGYQRNVPRQSYSEYDRSNNEYNCEREVDMRDMYSDLPPTITPRFSRAHIINRREKEPEKFDGKSVDWKDYIVQFEQVATWNNWTDFEKAQQLSMSLRGTAQKILGDLKLSVVHNYALLKSVLAQRFNPKERVTASRCEFSARKRKSGENLSDFGYALRRHVRLAYPDSEYNSVLEQLVINQFITGLCHTDMEKHVQFSHPETLEEAIASAVEYEAFTSAQNIPKKPKDETFTIRAINNESKVGKAEKPNKVNEENSNEALKEMFKSFCECVDKMNEKLDEIVTVNKNKKDDQKRKPVECWNCKKKGHIAKFCRSEKKVEPQNDKKESSNTKN